MVANDEHQGALLEDGVGVRVRVRVRVGVGSGSGLGVGISTLAWLGVG